MLLIVFAAVAASGHEADTSTRPTVAGFEAAPLMSASLRGEWALHDGVTAISFNIPLLKDLGLRIDRVESTADTMHPA